MATELVKWPFGAASTEALTATGSNTVEINNQMTIIDGVTTQATGNRTIVLDIDEGVTAGAIIIVKSKTAATETTIFSTGMKGATITGVAGKTFCATFIYDGTYFYECGTAVQVD